MTCCIRSSLSVSTVVVAMRKRPSAWPSWLRNLFPRSSCPSERLFASPKLAGIRGVPRPNRLKVTVSHMATTLGRAIQILRAAKGLSQPQLSRKCKISVPYLSLIESDQRQPSMHVLNALSKQLGVPVLFLVRRSMNENDQECLGPEGTIEKKLSRTLEEMRRLEVRLKQIVATERHESIQEDSRH